MYKTLSLTLLLFASVLTANAQSIDRVLQEIERNSPALQAQQQLGRAEHLAVKAENLPDGIDAEMLQSWDSNTETMTEISVTQGFDFPTAYFMRRKAANIKAEQLGHELNTVRQDLLLEAKLLCLDIIALRQEYRLLAFGSENARRTAEAINKAMETGEVNIIEKNRADMEWADRQGQFGMKKIELESALERLQNLNGGETIVFEDSLFSLPEEVIPFAQMQKEYDTRAPQLLSLLSEKKGAEADLKVTRHTAIPGITLGYYREMSRGYHLNSIIMGITVPLWKTTREIKRAKAQIAYAETCIESERIDRQSALKELYGRYEVLKTTFETMSRIDLQQGAVLKHLTEAFSKGELNETDYLSEVNALYDVTLQRIAVERDLHKVIAEINALNL